VSVKVEDDTITIDHLDFEHDIMCDVIDCEESAEWKFVLSCCGVTMFHCEECFWMTIKMKAERGLRHDKCGTDYIDLLNPERFRIKA
jgi:hypothetical protein